MINNLEYSCSITPIATPLVSVGENIVLKHTILVISEEDGIDSD